MTAAGHATPSPCPGPNDWVAAAYETVSAGDRAMLVFVVRHYGSTPRDQGTWMLIRPAASLGTLGGGEVERVVEATARDMLAGRRPWTRTHEKFLLGPDMGQCCGGGMEVLFEPIDESASVWLHQAGDCLAQQQPGFVVLSARQPGQPPSVNWTPPPANLDAGEGVHIQPLADARPEIVIYGAGHVARAFAAMAAQLPLRLTLVDDRRAELERVAPAANVETVFLENPSVHAQTLSTETAAVLVMTYSHALDYRLCVALLKNPDLRYIGLIGSKSKGARFRRRLELDDGLSAAEIARLICPIGQATYAGKEPGQIALSSLNEIMTVLTGAVSRQQLNRNEKT